MRKPSTEKRIRTLLDALKANFPRQKAEIERLMRERYDLHESVDLWFKPAEPVEGIPTFSTKKVFPATPMLKARFDYASTVEYAGETWLGVGQMQQWMRKRNIKSYHKALRDNFENSAPMLFRDDQLTLFEVTKDVPDNLTYLVWTHENGEPEVWSYRGFDSQKFLDLEEYLASLLRGE